MITFPGTSCRSTGHQIAQKTGKTCTAEFLQTQKSFTFQTFFRISCHCTRHLFCIKEGCRSNFSVDFRQQ